MTGRLFLLALLAGVLPACEKPNSIELGGACKGSAECKAPADTCLTIATKSTCSMACTKDNRCPEGYACPVTDPTHKTQGMCLPKADIAPSVVTVY
jgi:hypothetical protein